MKIATQDFSTGPTTLQHRSRTTARPKPGAIPIASRKKTGVLAETWYKLRHWETWHWLVKYIPLLPAWMWYSLRSGSVWFFTPSNPTLTFGGFDGERKKEMYDQLPPGSFPKSIFISATFSFYKVQTLINRHHLRFPLAVKPDVGRMGLLFRKIETLEELACYHYKVKIDYIVQEFVHYPLEVSVFYYRFPHQKKGTITGFVRKDHLQVKGDGQSTLRELILSYDRVRFRKDEMFIKHAMRLDDVIPRNEIFILSQALNLSRGGKLVSLEYEKDELLLRRFDEISHHAEHFYYGRYDIKCESIDDLKKGKNFLILEYNGSGAEPHHVYGNGYSYWQAIGILLDHWRIMFEISKENHQRGISYWSFRQGWRQMRMMQRHLARLRKLDRDPHLLLPV
jgi:hypothetical protein